MCVLISVSWKMSGVYIIIRSSKFLHFLRFQLIFSGTLGVLDVLQKDLSNGIACYLNVQKREHGFNQELLSEFIIFFKFT